MRRQFYEISAVRSIDSIIIGGHRRQVPKVMAFKTEWLEKNWRAQILTFTLRLASLVSEPIRPQRGTFAYRETDTITLTESEDLDGCCSIL